MTEIPAIEGNVKSNAQEMMERLKAINEASLGTKEVNFKQIREFLRSCPYVYCIFRQKELIVSWELPFNFTILGRGAVVDVSKFDFDIGFEFALDDAARQMQRHEGYLLQKICHEKGLL